VSRIAIVGDGSWGTALALALNRRGDHSIVLWAHSALVAQTIERQRENLAYLPGYRVGEEITITAELGMAVTDAAIVISALPSQHVREVYRALAPCLNPSQVLVSATKGIEDGSYLRMSEVIAEEVLAADDGRFAPAGLPLGVLSGPSFAQEVAAGSPTAITIACARNNIASRLREELNAPGLRVYTNDDVVGVELGGALKNVIAIATGIATGLGLGHNSVAAIITRGIAEITRLAVACGGHRETLAGLSGLGDLVLTCTGPLSRNRSVGIELGRGRKLPEILIGLEGRVAEGVSTTGAALGLAKTRGVEMPITEQMSEILDHGRSPQDAIRELMARPGREE
jgi:glycerol-3-phosphate dehydrogenase (NAD(P)+)